MRNTRLGFTLTELVVSLVGASALMVGLASTIYVAIRASDSSNSPTANTLEGLWQLSDLSAELRFALSVTEQTATAITFTVPDRNDADANPESIRYAWSGTAGDPLTRQYNGGGAAEVAKQVHDFNFDFYQPATAIEYVTVRLQPTSDSQTSVETAVPLLNRP